MVLACDGIWYVSSGQKKEYSCFRKCGWREKSSPPQIVFWSIFLRYSLFFFSFFCFICILTFLSLVCLFFEIKNIQIHIQQCGRVNDKKVFTLPISGNKATFFCGLSKVIVFFVSNVILPLKKILLKALIVNIEFFLRDRREILLLMSEFKRIKYFCFPWNNEKTYGFLMISEGIEVN